MENQPSHGHIIYPTVSLAAASSYTMRPSRLLESQHESIGGAQKGSFLRDHDESQILCTIFRPECAGI